MESFSLKAPPQKIWAVVPAVADILTTIMLPARKVGSSSSCVKSTVSAGSSLLALSSSPGALRSATVALVRVQAPGWPSGNVHFCTAPATEPATKSSASTTTYKALRTDPR